MKKKSKPIKAWGIMKNGKLNVMEIFTAKEAILVKGESWVRLEIREI